MKNSILYIEQIIFDHKFLFIDVNKSIIDSMPNSDNNFNQFNQDNTNDNNRDRIE